MPLKPGPYEAYQLQNGDGSPVIHNGREVWVGRCGRELTGNRTDGLPANMVPAVFLADRPATVKVTPGEGATSPGEVIISPGPGFQPFGFGGGFGGGGAGGAGGGVEILGAGQVLREDREVWVGRACVPTGTPPQLPLGGHMGVPLGADFDRAGDTRRVMAGGCVECEVPPPPPPRLCEECPTVMLIEVLDEVFNAGCLNCTNIMQNGGRWLVVKHPLLRCFWDSEAFQFPIGPGCVGCSGNVYWVVFGNDVPGSFWFIQLLRALDGFVMLQGSIPVGVFRCEGADNVFNTTFRLCSDFSGVPFCRTAGQFLRVRVSAL